jgi:hypothetical protein
VWFTDPDGDELEYTVENSDHITGVINGNLLTITPASNWSGQETIRILCNDSEFSVFIDMQITVNPVNDPPSEINIILPDKPFNEGEGQTVSVSAEDNEFSSEELTYEWFEDGELIGTGQSIDLDLSEGSHLITVKVKDPDGAESSKTFSVDVEKGADGDFPMVILIVVIVLVVLIVAVIGIILFLNKSKKDPPEEEVKDEIDLLLENDT